MPFLALWNPSKNQITAEISELMSDIDSGLVTVQQEHRSEFNSPSNGVMSLGKLFLQTHTCEATDPRHKIYSLTGLAKGRETLIIPDCRISLAKVYT